MLLRGLLGDDRCWGDWVLRDLNNTNQAALLLLVLVRGGGLYHLREWAILPIHGGSEMN